VFFLRATARAVQLPYTVAVSVGTAAEAAGLARAAAAGGGLSGARCA
jgi:hypothetical protein